MISTKKIKILIEPYQKIAYDYLLRFRDVRFAGQVAFVIIVLLITWSGIKAIDANYALQQEITALQKQNEIQKLENNNIQLQNQYYQSKQYLELSARQNFGLAKPGEKELIVPPSVALSYVVQPPQTSTAKRVVKPKFYEYNLKSWIDFFLHRSPPPD